MTTLSAPSIYGDIHAQRKHIALRLPQDIFYLILSRNNLSPFTSAYLSLQGCMPYFSAPWYVVSYLICLSGLCRISLIIINKQKGGRLSQISVLRTYLYNKIPLSCSTIGTTFPNHYIFWHI